MSLARRTPLFDVEPAVVNVATVRQLSPLRYPGGKTWFVPYLKRWLASLPFRPAEFIEPFAGGASAGLTVLYENLADRVILVEKDRDVVAVWKAIFEGDAVALAEEISRFDLNLNNVRAALSREPNTLEERAFQTILRNRINRGGILAPGAGMVKEGENGRGIRSRWYPQTLKRRILCLAPLRDRVTVVEGDGLLELEQRLGRSRAVAFIDPPYTAGRKRAGSRLYVHSELDHPHLFHLASRFAGDFLMTYDDDSMVEHMALRSGFQIRRVPMKNTHHSVMYELIVGKNLGWLD
ncbi:DNA adenine methylase [Calidithermus roseus]|uniref:site-specific DNA-methyltransferase (adenine-specific) n=1 Tax=Calidithermus roseus TaxID=1644118 RepID=A0A399EYE8_9DEIN|nr:DNA adenine methylase [Calidithermus roseus]RIH88793.1 DNA adenine methylase [Calidithermus roseus]